MTARWLSFGVLVASLVAGCGGGAESPSMPLTKCDEGGPARRSCPELPNEMTAGEMIEIFVRTSDQAGTDAVVAAIEAAPGTHSINSRSANHLSLTSDQAAATALCTHDDLFVSATESVTCP